MPTKTIREAVVRNGPQELFVGSSPHPIGLIKPHVVLRVGETLDSQMMRLTPSDARRVAVALLQAAEEVEEGV